MKLLLGIYLRERATRGKTLADALYAVDWLFIEPLLSTGQVARLRGLEAGALKADRDHSIEGIEVNTSFFKLKRLPRSFKVSMGNPSHSVFRASKRLKRIELSSCLQNPS